MKQVYYIAVQTVLRAVRKNIITAAILLFVTILLILNLFSFHHYGFEIKFIKDLSLNFLSLLAGIILLFLGYEQVFWFEKKQIPYHVITRLNSRKTMVFGVAFGIIAVISITLFSAAAIMLVFLKITRGIWFWELINMAFLLSLQFCLISSLLIFLSSFLTKLSALSLTVLIYVISNINDSIIFTIQQYQKPYLTEIYQILSSLLPDFSLFAIRAISVNDCHFTTAAFVSIILYTIFLSGFYLLLAGINIDHHDL